MTNDQYLIVSYFGCAALGVTLGAAMYFFLRRSFGDVADAAPGRQFPELLKRLFPFGLVFPALLGFVSASYSSCDRKTYADIVKSRRYLVGKNQEQIASILLSILVAVVVWNVVALVILKRGQDSRSGS